MLFKEELIELATHVINGGTVYGHNRISEMSHLASYDIHTTITKGLDYVSAIKLPDCAIHESGDGSASILSNCSRSMYNRSLQSTIPNRVFTQHLGRFILSDVNTEVSRCVWDVVPLSNWLANVTNDDSVRIQLEAPVATIVTPSTMSALDKFKSRGWFPKSA